MDAQTLAALDQSLAALRDMMRDRLRALTSTELFVLQEYILRERERFAQIDDCVGALIHELAASALLAHRLDLHAESPP